MEIVLHKAATRGHANHGWLNSYHTFSFANYYDPEREKFGVLRVLNDDEVSAGMGFGKHGHSNMEIISIPLEGDLEHEDSMGNKTVIRAGDIQVMSAGTGVQHSEKNKNMDRKVKFLQIWVIPNKVNVQPRYDQIALDVTEMENTFKQILSPNRDDEGVWIYQNAWFHLGHFKEAHTTTYELKEVSNGLYVFVLEGECNIEGTILVSRDGLGIRNASSIDFEFTSFTKILLMEVPMSN
ncbi:pirin family protein [Croceitalea rosinachiae]|uniref:Pirin family protein n=1 Tax=Croceitalea rosinachiae TaxID=3075596 RepID=A0ABU3AB45_9FLAO|nr:pirin family protein [Croceitalea sp. F388]MDT0606136.1 pirin family protein [Croceitalea sp. F388]